VLLDHVGKDVIALLPDRGEAYAGGGREVLARPGGQVTQEGAAEGVVLEDAVPRRATDAARLAPVEERLAAVGGDDTVMDLVAGHRLAERGARRAAQRLAPLEPDRRRQQTQPWHGPGTAFHLIVNAACEHLVAAADAEQRAVPPGSLGQGPGDAAFPHPGQVADRGPAAGHDDQVRAVELAGSGDQVHGDARLGRQRVDVGDVGHAGQADDRDPQRVRASRRQHVAGPGVQVEGVLGVQPQVTPPGQDSVRGPAGHGRQHVESWLQQPLVSAELVDDEPGDVALVGGAQDREGAIHGGEDPASVNVPDDDHGQVRRAGQPHVRDVPVAQVDLGRAARALADHHVKAAAQAGEALRDGLLEHRLEVLVIQRARLGHRLAEQHDLAAGLAAGLEQHRVHRGFWLHPGGSGLHRLGAADLRAVGGDGGVQRHVLRLERRHLHAAAGQPAAQPGD
jgi:hypothetical protein